MWRTRGALHTERAHFQPLFPNLHWGCNQLFYICLSISKFNPLKNIPNCTAARESNLYVRSHEKIPFSRGILKTWTFAGVLFTPARKEFPWSPIGTGKVNHVRRLGPALDGIHTKAKYFATSKNDTSVGVRAWVCRWWLFLMYFFSVT
jgi:hypothetical protein